MTTRDSSPAPLSVVIGAGGTGGHIYPGLALAEALRAAVPGAVVSFIGTERGLETELIPRAGYRLHTVDMIPFDPALGAKRYLLPAALLRSAGQARAVIRAQGRTPSSAWAATRARPPCWAPGWPDCRP